MHMLNKPAAAQSEIPLSSGFRAMHLLSSKAITMMTMMTMMKYKTTTPHAEARNVEQRTLGSEKDKAFHPLISWQFIQVKYSSGQQVHNSECYTPGRGLAFLDRTGAGHTPRSSRWSAQGTKLSLNSLQKMTWTSSVWLHLCGDIP